MTIALPLSLSPASSVLLPYMEVLSYSGHGLLSAGVILSLYPERFRISLFSKTIFAAFCQRDRASSLNFCARLHRLLMLPFFFLFLF